MESAIPQVALGDPVTGIGSDNIRQCFGKYNEHAHLVSSSSNPLTKGISPGEKVQLVKGCDYDLLPSDTEIFSISSTQVVLTQEASRSALASLQIGTRIIDHCLLSKDSNILQILPLAGFISGSLLDSLVSKPITLFIPQTQSLTYPLFLNTPWRGVLERLTLTTLAGSLTAELLINDRMVSTTSVTSIPNKVDYEDTLTNRTRFLENDSLYLRLTNTTGNPALHVSLSVLITDPSSTVAVRQGTNDPTATVLFPPDYDYLVID